VNVTVSDRGLDSLRLFLAPGCSIAYDGFVMGMAGSLDPFGSTGLWLRTDWVGSVGAVQMWSDQTDDDIRVEDVNPGDLIDPIQQGRLYVRRDV
jgi:hypothetical protein